jgi:ABC-type transport system involved in cytochrome c biogenesis permease subunit
MVLVSSGQLIEQLGLDKTHRRFSFTQLAGSAELRRLASEARTLKRAEKPLTGVQQEALSVSDRLTLLAHVIDGSALLIIPASAKETDPWVDPSEWSKYYAEAQFAPVQIQLQTTVAGYVNGDAFNFSRAANQLRQDLRSLSPPVYPQDHQLRLEDFYNHFEGFYRAIWFYGIALVILIVAQLRKRGWALRNIGVAVALLGLAFHTGGIVMRCMIAGRPPVTNMYESIIWVSFAVSFFGMIFFARYRAPVYLLAALPVTLIALLLVHQMPIAMPSSIDPLVPVLRDNFWLTVHVLTITLSYAAFALAMGFGHILLWRCARNPAAARADAPMHFWLYRVLQLGVLLLAAGTILGGVWANYSWGRFWGWDPKETWALIALLSYILALHGRLAGWWTQFGLAVASVVCFLAVLMAWYGVNFVVGKVRRREVRQLAPILGLHLAVELRQRVIDDLTEHRLDSRVIRIGVIHKNARNDKRQRRGGTHHRRDPGGLLALPVRANDQIEAGFGAVLLADLGEFVGARVIVRVNPETISEVRNLKNDGFFVQCHVPGAIHDILICAGDKC